MCWTDIRFENGHIRIYTNTAGCSHLIVVLPLTATLLLEILFTLSGLTDTYASNLYHVGQPLKDFFNTVLFEGCHAVFF